MNIYLNRYINEWIFLLHRNPEILTVDDFMLNIVDCVEEVTHRSAQVLIDAYRLSKIEYHVCHIDEFIVAHVRIIYAYSISIHKYWMSLIRDQILNTGSWKLCIALGKYWASHIKMWNILYHASNLCMCALHIRFRLMAVADWVSLSFRYSLFDTRYMRIACGDSPLNFDHSTVNYRWFYRQTL